MASPVLNIAQFLQPAQQSGLLGVAAVPGAIGLGALLDIPGLDGTATNPSALFASLLANQRPNQPNSQPGQIGALAGAAAPNTPALNADPVFNVNIFNDIAGVVAASVGTAPAANPVLSVLSTGQAVLPAQANTVGQPGQLPPNPAEIAAAKLSALPQAEAIKLIAALNEIATNATQPTPIGQIITAASRNAGAAPDAAALSAALLMPAHKDRAPAEPAGSQTLPMSASTPNLIGAPANTLAAQSAPVTMPATEQPYAEAKNAIHKALTSALEAGTQPATPEHLALASQLPSNLHPNDDNQLDNQLIASFLTALKSDPESVRVAKAAAQTNTVQAVQEQQPANAPTVPTSPAAAVTLAAPIPEGALPVANAPDLWKQPTAKSPNAPVVTLTRSAIAETGNRAVEVVIDDSNRPATPGQNLTNAMPREQHAAAEPQPTVRSMVEQLRKFSDDLGPVKVVVDSPRDLAASHEVATGQQLSTTAGAATIALAGTPQRSTPTTLTNLLAGNGVMLIASGAQSAGTIGAAASNGFDTSGDSFTSGFGLSSHAMAGSQPAPELISGGDNGPGFFDLLAARSGLGTSLEQTLASDHPANQAPTQSVPPEHIAMQIAVAAQAGARGLTLQLRPQALGQIDVQLRSGRDGSLRVRISAERAQTLSLLESDAEELTRTLSEAGIETEPGGLSFDLRGQSQDRESAASQTPFIPAFDAPRPAHAQAMAAFSRPGATATGLDIRV